MKAWWGYCAGSLDDMPLDAMLDALGGDLLGPSGNSWDGTDFCQAPAMRSSNDALLCHADDAQFFAG